MKILVCSDCHGSKSNAEKAIFENPSIKEVFFLGDGASAVEEIKTFYPDRNIRILSGNCDLFSIYPSAAMDKVGEMRVFYTHGHLYNVKYGIYELLETAKKRGVGLVLYGHTHIAHNELTDGIRIVNPGALSGSRSGQNGYAVISIEGNKTEVEFKKL